MDMESSPMEACRYLWKVMDTYGRMEVHGRLVELGIGYDSLDIDKLIIKKTE